MALPFDLAAVSRGFAELTPGARQLGLAAAAGAARALGQLLGCDVALEAAAAPATAAPRPQAVRLTLELPALPARAALDVEPALVVRLVDRLGGGDGALHATALTPIEEQALSLFALVALDGVCEVTEIEDALRPRLAAGPASLTSGALAVELTVRAGPVRGAARLLVPPEAVRALARAVPDAAAPSALALPVAFRSGQAAVTPDELDALAPGDVLLLERPPSGVGALILPGGFRALGRLEPQGFHVEETHMPTSSAQIPITLEVELARVDLTLSELARLEPGAVLPLGIDRRGEVTLRAGERAVARGELVEVDGAIGVRITAVEVTP